MLSDSGDSHHPMRLLSWKPNHRLVRRKVIGLKKENIGRDDDRY